MWSCSVLAKLSFCRLVLSKYIGPAAGDSQLLAGGLPAHCWHVLDMGCRWRDTAVARASDDFYPRDPASSTPHISACAFLSLFLSPLVQPDWDMFHRCGLCCMSQPPHKGLRYRRIANACMLC